MNGFCSIHNYRRNVMEILFFHCQLSRLLGPYQVLVDSAESRNWELHVLRDKTMAFQKSVEASASNFLAEQDSRVY